LAKFSSELNIFWAVSESAAYSIFSLTYKYELSNKLYSLPNSSKTFNGIPNYFKNGLFIAFIKLFFPVFLFPNINI